LDYISVADVGLASNSLVQLALKPKQFSVITKTTIQNHRSWYQSIACTRLPISQ